MAVAVAEEMTEDAVFSSPVRLDIRTTVGGAILHGTDRISAVAEEEVVTATLTTDGTAAAGWSSVNPQYDSTKLSDGWHSFALQEGTAATEHRLLALNASDIVVHEGVLEMDETWRADKLHIVRHWVRVPEGITLTIASKAIVKFCEETGILVEGALAADRAVFTIVADDSVGGDADMNGASFSLGYATYQIMGDGEISMDGCDARYSSSANVTEVSAASSPMRLDIRTSVGGAILHGMERISPMAENGNAAAKLTADGAAAAGWSSVNPQYDSTKLSDGWHSFALQEGTAATEHRLLALNATNVVVHEGVLEMDETWRADKLHVVRHWVRVPEGITLTIASKAIVKFCEDTGIMVEGALSADGAVFTIVADDSIGGDADMNGASFSLGYVTYQIMGDGEISMKDCDSRYMVVAGATEYACASAPFRFDVRSSVGGRMIYGTEFISPVVEDGTADAQLNVDGTLPAGWSAEEPWFDAASVRHGWHAFSLSDVAETELLSINRGDFVVHEGVLEADETWAAGKKHIVRHWVRVPKGVILDIEPNSVVKFCEDTGIWVEEGGTITGEKVVFTSVMDDSDGGDADMNGEAEALSFNTYDITGDGVKSLANCTFRYLTTLPADVTWGAGDVIHILERLVVSSGVTLTIQPGAVVKFATGASLVAEGGVINAKGGLFTHIADDSEEAGGDTNGDGDATVPVYDAYTLTGFTPSGDCELRYISHTYTGGTIKSGETKMLAGNRVHQVTGNITVASGGKLIILPGAIVKMNAGLSITVNKGGTLEAIGNRAQPIVFTSIKDDAHGGDTNGDGNKTMVQPGDWGTLLLKGGSGEFEYCSFLYAGGVAGNEYNACANVFMWSNGSGVFKCCVFAHSAADGCFAQQSAFENCIFTDCDRGLVGHASKQNARNCIFHDNAHGAVGHGGTMNLMNSIFYQNQEADVSNYGSTPNVAYVCVYSPNQSAIRNGYIRVTMTSDVQNICKDPLFVDADNGDFTLKAGSPCIDAGDGTVAPEFDYWGKPRMNVAKIADSGKPNADGVCPDIGIYEMPGVGGGDAPDLTVADVVFESKAYRQGDWMTVTWSDVNAGDAVAVGPWRDVVSLVRKDEQVTYVVEGDSVTIPATLKSGGSYSLSTRFRLPALLPGEWKVQVAVNQYRDVFEGEGGESNILQAEEAFTVEMDELAAGKTTLAVNVDESKTVMLAGGATAGAVLRLTAANGADIAVAASAGRIPAEDEYHWHGVQIAGGQWIVAIPQGTDGDVFVTVANKGDGMANVSVERSTSAAAVFGTDVSEVANGGQATIVIYGAGLEKAVAAELGTIPATNVHALSSMELIATFDLGDAAIGDYLLTVTLEGGRVLTMDGAIAVSQGAVGPKLMAGFSMPETLRPGRWYSGTITYRNDGDRDAIAPILYLTGNDVTFLDTDDGFTEHAGHIVLAGLASDGDPSVIRPGRTYTVNVKFKGTAPNASSVGIHFTFLDPNEDELEWNMLLGGDNDSFLERKADLETKFGTPLNLLKAAYEICGRCSQYGRPVLDVLSVMEKLAAKPNDVEYGYVSGVMVSRDDGQVLANCNLVVDGGENDVCYVKTDGGGRFCAWGVPIGRTITFGGPEGFYYFTDGEVVLNDQHLEGLTVYRRAVEDDTTSLENRLSDYQMVSDKNGDLWNVWVNNGRVFVALANDISGTKQILPSSAGNEHVKVISSKDGGINIYGINKDEETTKITKTNVQKIFDDENKQDIIVCNYHEEHTMEEDTKENVNIIEDEDGRTITISENEEGLEINKDANFVEVNISGGNGGEGGGTNDEENVFEGVSAGFNFKAGPWELGLQIKPTWDKDTCCEITSGGSIIGHGKMPLYGIITLEADVTGSYNRMVACQYLLSTNAMGDCNPYYKVKEFEKELELDVFGGWDFEFNIPERIKRVTRISFNSELKFGIIGGGSYKEKETYHKNGTWGASWSTSGYFGIRIRGRLNANRVFGHLYKDYSNPYQWLSRKYQAGAPPLTVVFYSKPKSEKVYTVFLTCCA